MYKANVLVNARTASSLGTGARVVIDGRLGAAGSTDDVSLELLVDDARESARFGPEVGALALGGAADTRVDEVDATVAALGIDELRGIAEAIVDHLRSARPDVLVDVSITRSESENVLANSNGLVHAGRYARLSVSASAKRNRDGDLLTLSAGGTAHTIEDARVSPRLIADALIGKLARCDRSATLAAGDYPVVFAAEGVPGLLYPLMLGLGGENLVRGTSPLTRAVPRLARGFSLYSDATLFDGQGSLDRDGDGTAERRVDFVRDGEIVGGVFDAVMVARYARRFPDRASFAAPGCARRNGVSGTTSPGPAILAIPPGSCSDVFAGVDRGLYVEALFGVRMGNPISGEFSNSVYLGHLIERGEIVGRVKNIMVVGNVYDALSRVDAVGSVATWADDDVLAPPLRLASLRVASKR